eukprot:9165186-Alexandrium_andersonii.AAC.1
MGDDDMQTCVGKALHMRVAQRPASHRSHQPRCRDTLVWFCMLGVGFYRLADLCAKGSALLSLGGHWT